MSDIPEDTQPQQEKKGKKLWKPGESGNPEGRPRGARSKFGEDFVEGYAEHWAKHGERVLDELVEKDIAAYSRIACAILPKVIELDDETLTAIKDLSKAMPFDAIRYRTQDQSEKPATTH